MPFPTQNRPCPKCATPMMIHEVARALPQYIDSEHREKADSPNISTKYALPVELWFCPHCRFLELFAG